MFTGLVADVGSVEAADEGDGGLRLTVRTPLVSELSAGDSVALNGVCLTATRVDADGFTADVMPETLRRSSLGALEVGSRVNLELPVRPGDRLGGHFVQGHVDAMGSVRAAEDDGFARVVHIEAPPDVVRYVVEKGSVAVDGVSLTVAAVEEDGFSVSLIPETRERTNLGGAAVGTPVNLEVDLLAKYVERLVAR